MVNRAELTDQELGFACGANLIFTNIFVGIMLGTMAWVPVSLIYAGMQIGLPRLPTGNGAIAITTGICVGAGVLWGLIAGERYRDISFRFNRVYFKVCRDNIVRTQVLWVDVESVKRGTPYVIQTRQGLRIEVPAGALLSERYDNRALKNQLAKFQKPPATPSTKKFAWIGFVTLCIGAPMLVLSKRPTEVFAESDGITTSVWLRILPSILGCVGTVTGIFCLMIWMSLLAEKKKQHPYQITGEGIREGNNLISWTDIQRVNLLGIRDMQIQIRLQKGPPRFIDCDKYTDGVDLRDAIVSLAPQSVLQPLSGGPSLLPGQTLTAKSWTTLRKPIGCLAVFAVLGLVLVFMAATGRMSGKQPSDAVGFAAIGLVSSLMLVSVILLACYRVELSESEISYKRPLFPCRRITIVEIDSIEIRTNRGKNGPIDLMTIRAKPSSITISSNLEKFGEIRDSILQQVPAEKVRYS